MVAVAAARGAVGLEDASGDGGGAGGGAVDARVERPRRDDVLLDGALHREAKHGDRARAGRRGRFLVVVAAAAAAARAEDAMQHAREVRAVGTLRVQGDDDVDARRGFPRQIRRLRRKAQEHAQLSVHGARGEARALRAAARDEPRDGV